MCWPNPNKTSELSNVVCNRLAKTINPLQLHTALQHYNQHYEDIRVSEDLWKCGIWIQDTKSPSWHCLRQDGSLWSHSMSQRTSSWIPGPFFLHVNTGIQQWLTLSSINIIFTCRQLEVRWWPVWTLIVVGVLLNGVTPTWITNTTQQHTRATVLSLQSTTVIQKIFL